MKSSIDSYWSLLGSLCIVLSSISACNNGKGINIDTNNDGDSDSASDIDSDTYSSGHETDADSSSTFSGCDDCDDRNVCTVDRCIGTTCEHEPVEFQLVNDCIDEYTHAACIDGVLTEASCPGICIDAGHDAFHICLPGSGCGCVDSNQGTPCLPGTVGVCYSEDALFVCSIGREYNARSNFWLVEDCTSICQQAGYDFTVGCRNESDRSVCYCDSCKEPGEECEVGDCCRDGECTWVDFVGAVCVSYGPCPDECKHGSICCRGNYCGGDCVGSPCCI